MPIYEYLCPKCGKKSSFLLGISEADDGLQCQFCGAGELTRTVSRFKKGRDEDARLDEISDHLDLHGTPDSYAGIREFARETGKAMDEDFADEMEEMLEHDTSDEN